MFLDANLVRIPNLLSEKYPALIIIYFVLNVFGFYFLFHQCIQLVYFLLLLKFTKLTSQTVCNSV